MQNSNRCPFLQVCAYNGIQMLAYTNFCTAQRDIVEIKVKGIIIDSVRTVCTYGRLSSRERLPAQATVQYNCVDTGPKTNNTITYPLGEMFVYQFYR